jgi:phosphoenolpyruvate carboxykinase (ATP)
VGERIKLKHTRAIINAIHNGALLDVPTESDEHFNLEIPVECPEVPQDILRPWLTWRDRAAYDRTARKLADRFVQNFAIYKEDVSQEMIDAGPTLQTM